MTLSDARARLRRGFARIWQRVVNLFRKMFHAKHSENTPGWPTPAKDEAHGIYRERFERFAEGLPGLERTKTNETTEAFLAVAQTAQMLHEYGDDPIQVPGSGRIVRPDDRLASFGAVGQASGFMGAVSSSASLWIVAAGLVVCGSGWVTNEISSANYKAERAEHAETKGDLEEAQVAAARVLAERNVLAGRLEIAEAHSRQSAETLRQERVIVARAAENERRRRRELEQVNNGGPPPDWERSLRNDDAVGAGGPAASGGDHNP